MFFCSDWARPVAMWLGVPVLLVADTGDFDSHTCQVCTKEPYAYTHTADSTGRFHTTSYESTADARDAAVLAKRDGAVVLVFTTPTPHRLGHFDATSRLPASDDLTAAMGSKAAMAPAPAPERTGTRSARNTRRAC